MPDIDILLSTLPWKARLREALEQVLAPAEVIWVSGHDATGIRRALKRADVAILAGDLDAGFLDEPRLTWVHCGHAGLERSAMPAAFERGLVVTSAAGRSAPALAVRRALSRSFRMFVPTRAAELSASPRPARFRHACITADDNASRETALGHKRR